MIVSAPKDEQELRDLLYTALKSDSPFAIRYPRGAAYGVPTEGFKEIPIGRWEELVEGDEVVVIGTGFTVYQALKSAEDLYKEGIKIGVVNGRFVKPIDEEMLEKLAGRYEVIVTVEDNTVVGGFGSTVLEWFAKKGITKKVINLGVPDMFIEHGNQKILRNKVGIDSEGISKTVRSVVLKKTLEY